MAGESMSTDSARNITEKTASTTVPRREVKR